MKIHLDAWQAWAVLSAVFAALTALFAKIGVRDINPEWATFIRVLIILAVVGLIAWAAGGGMPDWSAVPRKTYFFLALSAVATGLSWLCYFRALQMGPASGVAPLDKLSVVFVAILAALFLKERPGMEAWLGIVLIAAGGALVAASEG